MAQPYVTGYENMFNDLYNQGSINLPAEPKFSGPEAEIYNTLRTRLMSPGVITPELSAARRSMMMSDATASADAAKAKTAGGFNRQGIYFSGARQMANERTDAAATRDLGESLRDAYIDEAVRRNESQRGDLGLAMSLLQGNKQYQLQKDQIANAAASAEEAAALQAEQFERNLAMQREQSEKSLGMQRTSLEQQRAEADKARRMGLIGGIGGALGGPLASWALNKYLPAQDPYAPQGRTTEYPGYAGENVPFTEGPYGGMTTAEYQTALGSDWGQYLSQPYDFNFDINTGVPGMFDPYSGYQYDMPVSSYIPADDYGFGVWGAD